MTERLLQYIWQFRYFNANDLETSSGDPLMIVSPGRFNGNQGPDFLEARIKIGRHTWIGNVELHIHASDWYKHSHTGDPNYENVILHVVWNNDGEYPVRGIPTLSLADRVSKPLLRQYAQWMHSRSYIPCSQYLYYPEAITWVAWKERLLVERLQRKSQLVMHMLEENNYHWEETCWRMLAKNYGLYVNAEAFEEIARSVPYTLLMRHRNQLQQIEAILLGQAGLLKNKRDDPYYAKLYEEYCFYTAKYKLQPIVLPLHFLRMRPAAFPPVRLQQLAELIHKIENLFSAMLNTPGCKELKSLFPSSIIINTVIPLLFAYGSYHEREELVSRAIELARCLPAEKNSITLQFKKNGIENKNAADSQALIELKTQYCDKRRCLDCAIGNAILKRRI